MKRFGGSLFLFLLVLETSTGNPQVQEDQILHQLAGVAVVFTTTGAGFLVSGDSPEARIRWPILGLQTALWTGLIKEMIDFGGTGVPEVRDWENTAVGALAAGLLILCLQENDSMILGMTLMVSGIGIGLSVLLD